MQKKKWLAFLLTGAVLLGVSGCGNSTALNSIVGSNGSNTTQGSGSSSGTSGQGQGQGRFAGFQPNITMKTSPSTPVAGQPVTLEFSMQRPNASGFAGRGQGGGGQGGGGQFGNGTGGQGGGGQFGNGTGGQSTATAVVTGNSVNQTVSLSRQNGVMDGAVTIQQAGTYQVSLTMNIGPRTIQHQFTLNVSQ